MLSHNRNWPVQFLLCEFSVLHESCAYCWQSHTQIMKHYALLAVKWATFSNHINCFSGCMFTDMSKLLRLICQAIEHAWSCQHVTSIWSFSLYENCCHCQFPEVWRQQRPWQITVNGAGSNQSTTSTITDILLSHRQNLLWFVWEILFIPNSWPKNLSVAYVNTVYIVRWQDDRK
jgi:hypothetical protein